jgi:hypothetical protein
VNFLLSGGDSASSNSNVYQRDLNATILGAQIGFRSSEHRWSHRDRTATTADGFVWREDLERARMNKTEITGWVLSLVGILAWLYGYFSSGHTALLDWPAFAPWWIADYLPNIETEIGMVLMCVGTGASYWPKSGDVQA